MKFFVVSTVRRPPYGRTTMAALGAGREDGGSDIEPPTSEEDARKVMRARAGHYWYATRVIEGCPSMTFKEMELRGGKRPAWTAYYDSIPVGVLI
jgi:hypothetical protein